MTEGLNRLVEHIRFMIDVPEEGFAMRNFFAYRKQGWPKEDWHRAKTPPKRQDASCNTAACVAGWLVVAKPKDWTAAADGCPMPVGSTTRPWDYTTADVYNDVAEYFEITVVQAREICCPMEYDSCEPSQVEVLQRMCNIAEGYGANVSELRSLIKQ